MTVPLLCMEIKKMIERATVNVQLGADRVAPKVFLGHLPISRAGEQPFVPDFVFGPDNTPRTPYALVQPAEGEEMQDMGKAKIGIIVGVYDESDDNQGYMYVLNAMEEIKQYVMKNGPLNDEYEIEAPIKWTLYSDDNYPHWFGMLTTTWTMPGIQREVSFLNG